MIRFITFMFLLIFFPRETRSQSSDLFDGLNSKRYADYLFYTKKFDKAISEYERYLFLCKNDTVSVQKLIQSYRFSNNYKQGLKTINSNFNQKPFPIGISEEYLKLNLLLNEFDSVTNYCNTNIDSKSEQFFFFSSLNFVMQAKYKDAKTLLDRNTYEQSDRLIKLTQINNQYTLLKYKNPYLSSGMSAIVPGLGKVYSGFWKDGLVSFIFTGISAYQTYRFFENNNTNKPLVGYLYAGISLGFYVGNIYGSAKSANQYNYNQKHSMEHEIYNIIMH